MRFDQQAVTLAEWLALELTRPLTDYAIGATTDARRSADAFASRCHATDAILDAIEAGCPPHAPDRQSRQNQRRRERNAARKAAATAAAAAAMKGRHT
jgi:hypothetical protein